MNDDGAEVERALWRVLARERAALLRGDLPGLAGLADTKADLIARLEAAPSLPAREQLERLRAEAGAVTMLLASAVRGVGAARARLDAVLRSASGFDTYDARGRSVQVGPGQSTIERRA